MSQTALHPNQAMALSQLYTNSIIDPALLDALAGTPRDGFVPKHLADCAYIDEDLHVGEGRYMLAPLDQARLIQAAAIQPTDRVLDVACGMGYSSAVLAKLSAQVIGVDFSALFKQHASDQFAALGLHNVTMEVVEDIAAGYEYAAPFDVMVINGGVGQVPSALTQQLSEGGRMVFVHTHASSLPGTQGQGTLTVLTKRGTRLDAQQYLECAVPALREFAVPEGFRFG